MAVLNLKRLRYSFTQSDNVLNISFCSYTILSFTVFIIHIYQYGFKNFQAELYITIVNSVISILAYYYVLSIRNKKDLRILSFLTSVFCLAVSFFAIVNQVGFELNSFDREERIFLPLISNSIAPTTFSIVVLLGYYIHFLFSSYYSRLYFWSTSLVYLFIIYLLATRFSLAGGLLILIASLRPLLRSYYPILLACLTLPIYLIFNSIRLNERLLHRISNLSSFESILLDESLIIRFILWKEALVTIGKNPFGIGYLTFVENHGARTPSGLWKGFNTHNELLLQAIANGWIVIIIILVITFKIVQIINRQNRTYLLALIGSVFVPSMFDTFSNNPGSINHMPMIFLSIALTLNKIENDKELNQLNTF